MKSAILQLPLNVSLWPDLPLNCRLAHGTAFSASSRGCLLRHGNVPAHKLNSQYPAAPFPDVSIWLIAILISSARAQPFGDLFDVPAHPLPDPSATPPPSGHTPNPASFRAASPRPPGAAPCTAASFPASTVVPAAHLSRAARGTALGALPLPVLFKILQRLMSHSRVLTRAGRTPPLTSLLRARAAAPAAGLRAACTRHTHSATGPLRRTLARLPDSRRLLSSPP